MRLIKLDFTGLWSWAKGNSTAFLIPLVGAGGAYFGAYYGSTVQLDLWRREKFYQFETDVLNKRVELIRSVVRSNVSAQRISVLGTAIEKYGSLLTGGCNAPYLDPQTSARCTQELRQVIDINAAYKEIADLQSDYFASLQLAAIYFCEKTKSAVNDLQQDKKNWWEVDASKRTNIVAAMANELGCGMNIGSLPK